MANNEIKTAIVVDLDDKSVTKGARNITRNTEAMTRNMIKGTQRVNAQYGNLNQRLTSTANGVKALALKTAALYGGAQSIRQVWEFNDGIRELQRTLNLSADEMDRYKQLLFDIQLRYGANKTAFSQYINEVARGVRTYEELEEKAKRGAIAIQGIGMDGKQAANFDWLLKETNAQNPEGVLNRAVNIGQNENGRFNANELLDGVYQVMQNWNGPKDQNAIYDIMTYLQMQSNDTQNVSDAVANFQSLISDLSSQRSFLKDRIGYDPFKKQGDQLVLKDLKPVLDLIVKDTQQGRISKDSWLDQNRTIQGKFSEGGTKAVMSLSAQSGNFEAIKSSQGADVEQIALDRSRNFASSIEKLMNVLERFADMNLAAPIDELSKAIASLDPEDVQDYLNVLKEVGTYVGGAYAVYKGGKMLKGTYDGAKGLLGTAVDVQKVYVTNMNEANPVNNKNLGIKSIGAAGLLENMAFVLQHAGNDLEKTDALRNEYGDDNIKRWMSEQGYSFLSTISMLNAESMQALILKGQLTDQYDIKKINGFNNPDSKWYKPDNDIKDIDYNELVKLVQDNASALSKPIEVRGDVSVDSKVVVEVRAAEGLTARVQSQNIESKGSLKTPEKLGYTGGGDY